MNDSPCLVSVFCTAYNHEKFLAQTIESIVSQQTDFPFELLINDDASTDGTADIIRRYAQLYPNIIRPFYQEKNLFSQGFDICHTVFFPVVHSKYTAYCEGDDYWTDTTKLQRQADFMEANPQYSACVHNTLRYYCLGNKVNSPLLSYDEDRDIGFENIIPGMEDAYHTSALFGKTELLAHPADYYKVAGQFGFGDYPNALWLRANGPIRYLNRCMSVYRINSNSDSWSSGVFNQYAKLKHFIVGKREFLKAYREYAPEEYKPLVDEIIREREFELMYIEGRDREQRKPPYREILRRKDFKYRMTNWLKCYVPGLQRMYRKRRGYEDY